MAAKHCMVRVVGLTVVLGCCMPVSAKAPLPVRPVDTVPSRPYDSKLPDVTPHPLIGDWEGQIKAKGDPAPLVAQVMAAGKGRYRVNVLERFDTHDPVLVVLAGQADESGKTVKLAGESKGAKWTAKLTEKTFSGEVKGERKGSFNLKRVVRLSPRLGAKPPAGAKVLLGPDTKDLNAEWVGTGRGKKCTWKLLDGGVMQCQPRTGSVLTRRELGDHFMHVEFRTVFEPDSKSQGRANSGVYILNRYECQILDSYGLEGKPNECGGLYRAVAPRVNMCAPPMQWQSYDIFFRAPRFDASGKKQVEPAHITVLHNGVLIHDDVKMSKGTGAGGRRPPAATARTLLQDHGHKVEFRNIWVADFKTAPGRKAKN